MIEDEIKYFTFEQVAKHNTEHDAWLIFDNHVLNITKLIKYHPGGKKILIDNLGKDITEKFNEIKKHQIKYIEKYIIGLVRETKEDIDENNIPKYDNNIIAHEYQTFIKLYKQHLKFCRSKFRWLFSNGPSKRLKIMPQEIIPYDDGYIFLYMDFLFILFKPDKNDLNIWPYYQQNALQIQNLNTMYDIVFLQEKEQKTFKFIYTSNNIKKSREIHSVCFIATMKREW